MKERDEDERKTEKFKLKYFTQIYICDEKLTKLK